MRLLNLSSNSGPFQLFLKKLAPRNWLRVAVTSFAPYLCIVISLLPQQYNFKFPSRTFFPLFYSNIIIGLTKLNI